MIGLTDFVYIFVFLLVFAISFGFLSKLDIFKREDINAIIAVIIAFLALLSTLVVVFIAAFIPEVMLLLLLIFVILLLIEAAGVPSEAIKKYLSRSALIPLLFIFILFLFSILAFGTAISMTSTPKNSSTTNTTVTITNPNVSPLVSGNLSYGYIASILTNQNVLSMIITLVIMALVVYFLTRKRVPV